MASAVVCAAQGHGFAQFGSRFAGIRTTAEWAEQREMILAGMQMVMGALPTKERPPVEVATMDRAEFAKFSREKIRFLGDDSDYIPAYLFIPTKLKKAAAGVLCLHQTISLGKGEPAGLGGNSNLHYARELAERGYVTLAPDYPNFGDYQFDPYQHGYASATMKGICNHRRAVDVLQSLPDVAKDRIGSIGHSLGGHNTLFLGVFDLRVKALATSCGFNSFRKYYGGNLTGWSHKGYMPLIAEKYGKDPGRMPFDFPEVIAALAPRPLFISAPLRDENFEVSGVRDCVDAARPIYERIFRAGNRLVAVYPDVGHEFPTAVRQSAYAFLDRWLRE
ncbi:MAG: alpha/beta hydrolase family protein [Acidobacteriota bacterium]